jgi:hypothetical protein
MHIAGQRREMGAEHRGNRDDVVDHGNRGRIRIARQRDQDVFERHAALML